MKPAKMPSRVERNIIITTISVYIMRLKGESFIMDGASSVEENIECINAKESIESRRHKSVYIKTAAVSLLYRVKMAGSRDKNSTSRSFRDSVAALHLRYQTQDLASPRETASFRNPTTRLNKIETKTEVNHHPGL